jgi:3-hydroxybutyryl-CoA dehydrogenase
VTERAKLADCDFIVEAATEKFEIKAEIFRDLDRLARPEVILASNTSSISITKLGPPLPNVPEKVIGMHFFNPVPVMKLVEVIRGLATSSRKPSRRCASWRSSSTRRRSR